MGFSGKNQHQFDGEFRETSQGKKWVISEISLHAPMKPISLSSCVVTNTEEDAHQDQYPTTPTEASVRIPTVLQCPPAPKKRKRSLKFSYGAGAREFFSPPDLETVFIQRAT